MAVSTSAALLFLIALTAFAIGSAAQGNAAPSGCYDGVMPLQPYLQSCSLPSGPPRVAGSAPSANEIIACRHHPGCLSWVVNNPH
jgi:hypothetical protein